MNKIEVIRLLPTVSNGWTLMPQYIARVDKFIQEYLPETRGKAIQNLQQTTMARWINSPDASGYWLALQDGVPIAHVCSWLAIDWGIPYIFVYQAEVDQGIDKPAVASSFLDQLDEWVAALNNHLGQQNPPSRITYTEFSTWRDTEAWVAYFERRRKSAVQVRSVIRLQMDNEPTQNPTNQGVSVIPKVLEG